MTAVVEMAAVAAPPSGQRRALRGILRSVVTFVVVTLLLLGLWVGFLDLFNVSPYVGKRPTEVWRYLFDVAEGPERRDILFQATKQTLWQALAGFVTGIAVAVAMAISFTLSRPFERAVLPIALALRSVPIVAMIPLLSYLFGRGTFGSLVIISIIVFFPALVLVTSGLRSVRPESLELLETYGAGPVKQLVKVRIPSALPGLLAASKVCAPLAILGAILNGWLFTGEGLGYIMDKSRINAAYVQLWAAVVIVTVLSVLFAAILSALEQAVYARYAPDRAGSP